MEVLPPEKSQLDLTAVNPDILGDHPYATDLAQLVRDYQVLLAKARPPYGFDLSADVLVQLDTKLGMIEKFAVPDEKYLAMKAVTDLLAEVADRKKTLSHLAALQKLPSGYPAKQLHLFWSGRQISDNALGNVCTWAKQAKLNGWKITVWTDAKNNTWSWSSQLKLTWNDVKLAYVDESIVDKRLWKAYDRLIHGATPNFPAASDLARYSILYKFGGVYLDVDLGPGFLPDLNVFLSPIRLPLLAPSLRDAFAAQTWDKVDEDAKFTLERITGIAAEVLATGQYNNNFIVCPAGSPALDHVINVVTAKLTDSEVETLAGPGASAAAAITGPFRFRPALDSYVQTALAVTLAQAQEIVTAALNKCPPLAWLTPESESQEH